MTLVSELDLPSFDPTEPSMRGERFHRAMRELSSTGWLAEGPFRYNVLHRESAQLYEERKWNILHINGADHTRLRSLVNPALSPRAVERYRPAMKEFLQQLLGPAVAASASANGGGQEGIVG